jgi:predicted nuclease with TOPRIM domain
MLVSQELLERRMEAVIARNMHLAVELERAQEQIARLKRENTRLKEKRG